jgi:hypothetical protein|mmetsp:Transcript_23568/g.58207  ORF Transcript_23568/g.58207 Transcript_23568/m.58207 type:complete len:112 (-) Transcript_23568:134-469(-)
MMSSTVRLAKRDDAANSYASPVLGPALSFERISQKLHMASMKGRAAEAFNSSQRHDAPASARPAPGNVAGETVAETLGRLKRERLLRMQPLPYEAVEDASGKYVIFGGRDC